MSASTFDTSANNTTMEITIDDSCSTTGREESDDQQSEVGDLGETESDPPLLHPDPSRMSSCLRAPCLKRNANSEAIGGSPLSGSGTSSPGMSSSPPSGAASIYSFSSIKILCAAAPKRQVHFDAAPPEAGLTHSGEKYDRRPIECTQGGSQLDLSLPPRGTCSRYADEADDEACEDDEEDEEGKQERLRGFARWARLKNGGSILGGATGVKFSSGRRNSEEGAEVSNVCSVPVHGIRSFGGLAGKSCLMTAGEVDNNEEEQTVVTSRKEDISSGEESESEDRQEAFRKAVYAALSMDPNATPMPSPSVRPRWESITSYFEPSNESDPTKKEESTSVVRQQAMEEDNAKEMPCSHTRTPLSKEQETCKVATWTKDQAASKDEVTPLGAKAEFSLTLPPPKVSPSISAEGSSGITHPSSSPMSSRCSSSDTWSSGCGAGVWSGSEQDAFDIAFSKGVAVAPPVAIFHTSTSRADPTSSAITSSSAEQALPTHPKQPSQDSQHSELEGHQEADHEQATSSSSSGGGPGWMSSCCTSPEMAAVDVDHSMSIDGALNKEVPASSTTVKAALMQRLAPLDLQRHYCLDRRSSSSIDTMSLEATPRYGSLLDRTGFRQTVSSPTSGESSPRILSTDEEEISRKSSSLFRCSSKKGRKARRTASGEAREESPEDSSRPGLSLRSKSMSAASSTKRVGVMKKTSVFNTDFDDEGALGGF